LDIFKSSLRLYPSEIISEKKIFRNLVLALLLFLFSLILPLLISLTGLNPVWSTISIVFLIILLVLLTKAEHIIAIILKRNKKLYESYNKEYQTKLKEDGKIFQD